MEGCLRGTKFSFVKLWGKSSKQETEDKNSKLPGPSDEDQEFPDSQDGNSEDEDSTQGDSGKSNRTQKQQASEEDTDSEESSELQDPSFQDKGQAGQTKKSKGNKTSKKGKKGSKPCKNPKTAGDNEGVQDGEVLNEVPVNKPRKPKKKINPMIFYPILVVISLVLGYFIEYHIYRPDMGVFLSSSMDMSGNIYVLGVNPQNDRYRITKVNSFGYSCFQIDLEKSNNQVQNTYRYLESDSKGNIYVVQEQRDKNAVTVKDSLYPILNESVLMYDTDGNYIKQVANMDFSNEAVPPTTQYIRKLQVIEQKVTIVGAKDYTYDVITANPLKDESPLKLKSFEIKPTVNDPAKNIDWVNDIAVLSNGRVMYSTKNGRLYAMDNQDGFLDYTDVIARQNICLSGLCVDSADNLYFTDMMSGTFYKLNTRSINPVAVYELDNQVIQDKDIKIRDLRTIKVVAEDSYYAVSKDFTSPYHVSFGNRNLVIDNIRGDFFPWGILIMLFISCCLLGIFWLIRLLLKWDIKRIPLAVRLTGMFLPIFLISMAMLFLILASDESGEYVSVLKNDQDTGAKIAADYIKGDDLESIDCVKEYMTSPYVELKNNIVGAYNDLSSKIGDKSDYIVVYAVKSNKIYSAFSNKYSNGSVAYGNLRYTDPDIFNFGNVLSDCVLERDETDTLYEVWNTFNSKTDDTDVIRSTFRDVYGDISVSFVPIKNSSGKAVGFVGNFMNASVHKDGQVQKIFRHLAALVIIISFVIFLYMCFVVKYCLRPIKTLEKGINAMSRGLWKTRIRVASKDELADVAETFNLLSEKIDTYTSNLILLNEKYVKFVPSEIFGLIGKSKITQVQLHDYKVMDMNVVYVTFNISCRDSFTFESEKELFDLLNASYEKFFDIVEKNRGVVQSFSGLSATILFPQSPQDAFNSSVQFKELSISEKIRDNMNITLGSGSVLVGVSGNKKRRGVLVISDSLLQLFNIDSHLRDLKINHVATKSIIEKLPQNGVCNYRFIGRVSHLNGTGGTDVYEMIDMTNQYKKDLYLRTKSIFEKAVRTYITQDFAQARKLFSDVLRVNDKDYVAINYLVKCDEETQNINNHNFDKKEWTGNLF